MNTPVIINALQVRLNTQTKLYCTCSAKEGSTDTCPRCQGRPGAIPVLNKAAVEAVLEAGIYFGSAIQKQAAFEKAILPQNSPKAYCLTQKSQPFCVGGAIQAHRQQIPIGSICLQESIGLDGCGLPLMILRLAQGIDQTQIPTVAAALHKLGALYGEVTPLQTSDDEVLLPETDILPVTVSAQEISKFKS